MSDYNDPIVIGNDVWIGSNTVYVGGVPAKVIRYRFTNEEIEILEKVKWWDWDIEEIKNKSALLKNPKLFFNKSM